MKDARNTLVTVIGGGGFIGRYVCEALFKAGVRVRVAQRNPRKAYALQPLAGIGQLDVVRADVTNAASLAPAVEGASAVVNLTGSFKHFEAIHVAGARAAADAAAAAGAEAFVHVSAIGADRQAEAEYSRSKARGEEAVRKAFARATIIRPSLVFGPEDQLTNRFASLMAMLPFYPVIAPGTRFQPVYVRDLGQGIAAAALDPGKHGGKTYEIAGPQVMTMRALTEAIASMSSQAARLVDMPDVAANALSHLGFLPGAPLTRDQWLMLRQDNVAGKKAPGLTAFGIMPTPLAAVAPDWLGRFREGGRFAANKHSAAA